MELRLIEVTIFGLDSVTRRLDLRTIIKKRTKVMSGDVR